MGIYLLMFGYVFVVGGISQSLINAPYSRLHSKYDNGATSLSAILVMLLPIILIGLRSSFGDTAAYLGSFKRVSTDFAIASENLDLLRGPLWRILQWAIKRYITQDPNYFLLVIAALQGCAVIRFYYRHSSDYPYSVLLFFLSMAFTYMMNGLRQFMALSVILFFSDQLFERHYFRFLFVIVVAAAFHSSALLWVPALFALQGKPFSWRVILSSIGIVLIIFYLDQFTDLLEDVLEDTSYEGYTNQFARDDGSNIMHTVILSVPVLLSIVCHKEIAKHNDPSVNMLVNLSVLAMMISVFANNTSGILAGRLPIYFSPFNYILLIWLFENAFTERSYSLIKGLSILWYLAFALYYMNYMNMQYSSTVLGF